MLRSLLVCALLVPLLGCGNDPDANPDNGDPTQVTYAEALNVDLAQMERRSSGLYVSDSQVGTGLEARRLNTVYVHYTGWLPDGTKFDSSSGGEPIDFILGVGDVIAGWDEGLTGMRVGGKRRLVIPSSLGYGEEGYPGVIPPYSVLIFDTELVEVR